MARDGRNHSIGSAWIASSIAEIRLDPVTRDDDTAARHAITAPHVVGACDALVLVASVSISLSASPNPLRAIGLFRSAAKLTGGYEGLFIAIVAPRQQRKAPEKQRERKERGVAGDRRERLLRQRAERHPSERGEQRSLQPASCRIRQRGEHDELQHEGRSEDHRRAAPHVRAVNRCRARVFLCRRTSGGGLPSVPACPPASSSAFNSSPLRICRFASSTTMRPRGAAAIARLIASSPRANRSLSTYIRPHPSR